MTLSPCSLVRPQLVPPSTEGHLVKEGRSDGRTRIRGRLGDRPIPKVACPARAKPAGAARALAVAVGPVEWKRRRKLDWNRNRNRTDTVARRGNTRKRTRGKSPNPASILCHKGIGLGKTDDGRHHNTDIIRVPKLNVMLQLSTADVR